jgi:hypothetical protein
MRKDKKMPVKKLDLPCIVCNPEEAQSGEYCERHGEQLHELDHRFETLFRFQRTSRGKDHETYMLFLQGDCDPCGRMLVTETDPENLFVTILISGNIDLDARIEEYDAFKIERTYGDQLRERVRQEIIHSWYGNARACVEIFKTAADLPQHWDIEPRMDRTSDEDDGNPESSPPKNDKHSIH